MVDGYENISVVYSCVVDPMAVMGQQFFRSLYHDRSDEVEVFDAMFIFYHLFSALFFFLGGPVAGGSK